MNTMVQAVASLTGRVVRGLKVVKSCSYGALPIHLFRHVWCGMYRLATMHSVTGQTDRRQYAARTLMSTHVGISNT